MKDPIVEEVCATRRRIFEEECNGDLEQLMARLKNADSLYNDRLVTREEVEKRRAALAARHAS